MNTISRNQAVLIFISVALILMLTVDNVAASQSQIAQTNFTNIDAYVQEQMTALGIPGLELGIVQGNEVVHLQGFGVADFSGRPVTPQTPFHVGSVTKPFTALAVMQLAEAGKLDLDAPVKKYLTWFEAADAESSAKVTVRNLLNHTSGVSTRDGNRIWVSKQGLEETLRGFGKLPLTHPVGTTWQYSNINYSLAGLIVEKVSGQSYSDYISQHILEPLDMRHSYTSESSAIADGLSAGHYYMFRNPIEGEGPLPQAYLPAGLLISTAEDLSHFAIAQLNDGQYGGRSVLSAEGIAEAHTPTIPMMIGDYRFGVGWAVGTVDGIPVLRHDGDTGYFHGIIFLQPDKKWGVILLANASGFMEVSLTDDIAKNVVGMLNGRNPSFVSVPFGMSFLYWSILLFPFVQIFGIVRSWRNRGHAKGWRVWATVLLNFVMAFAFLRVPIPFPMPSMLVFYPEVAYGLIIIATLGFGWGIVYLAMHFRNSYQATSAPVPAALASEAKN